MKIILTEKQFSLLSEGARSPSLLESLRKLHSFNMKLIRKVEQKYKLNLKFLATWGPAVGGLVMPLDNFIKTGVINVNENQAALILAGVAVSLFFDNRELSNSILKKIKEEGLIESFKIVLEKGKTLRNVFVRFIKSFQTTLQNLTDILAYSFLIPIITDIQSITAKNTDTLKVTELIVARLLASGLVLVAAEALKDLVSKIVRRFS